MKGVACRVCGKALTLSGDLWRNSEGVAFCPRQPCSVVEQFDSVGIDIRKSGGKVGDARSSHDSCCACLSPSLMHIPVFQSCYSETSTKGEAMTEITYDVPVNVKVKGEKAMRKSVVLAKNTADSVRVRTGKRGRPATLPVESIEKVTVLKVPAEKVPAKKKASANKDA